MSRALDKGVKEALKQGDPKKSFDDIARVLCKRQDHLLEIELLGRSHNVDEDSTFLQDGPAIAVPKLRLVQAFIHARQILFNHLNSVEPTQDENILHATSVMLLMDSEHLTGANTRKRIITKYLHKTPNDAKNLLLDEKFLIDSMLSSRLHRHTKSPVLWNHRRWLLDQMTEAGLPIDTVEDLRKVVFVAAERHPRNYYAWCHARELVRRESGASQMEGSEGTEKVLVEVQKWCFLHHDDISGWSFLLFLLSMKSKMTAAIIRETMNLAQSFHWRNESVWYFLRNAVLMPHAPDELRHDEFQTAWNALAHGIPRDTLDKKVLDAAASWVAAGMREI